MFKKARIAAVAILGTCCILALVPAAFSQIEDGLIADPDDVYASELLASLDLSDGNIGPAHAVLYRFTASYSSTLQSCLTGTTSSNNAAGFLMSAWLYERNYPTSILSCSTGEISARARASLGPTLSAGSGEPDYNEERRDADAPAIFVAFSYLSRRCA